MQRSIDDDYKETDLLGQGAFSEVYKVQNIQDMVIIDIPFFISCIEILCKEVYETK